MPSTAASTVPRAIQQESDMLMSEEFHDDGNDDNAKSSSPLIAAACPLFMLGLPTDFSTNPALAALASLMAEEVDDQEHDSSSETSRFHDRPEKGDQVSSNNAKNNNDKMVLVNSGGGKAQKIKSRHVRSRQSAPYPKQSAGGGKKNSPKSTVAEASLFLKMWKI